MIYGKITLGHINHESWLSYSRRIIPSDASDSGVLSLSSIDLIGVSEKILYEMLLPISGLWDNPRGGLRYADAKAKKKTEPFI